MLFTKHESTLKLKSIHRDMLSLNSPQGAIIDTSSALHGAMLMRHPGVRYKAITVHCEWTLNTLPLNWFKK
jgi:hypothetical protein